MFIEENENEGKITYAGISNGMIVVRTNAEDPKGKGRINKLGNQIYEKFYKGVGGTISTINVETNKFDETQIKVALKSEDDLVLLSFNFESAYGRSFLAQIFNVDFNKPVNFNPWAKVNDEGNKINRLYLSYGGRDKVEWKLPEGTPQVEWLVSKGKNVPDTKSQIQHNEFLLEKLTKLIEVNNLIYIPNITQESELQTPLSEEEKAELKDMKKSSKKADNSDEFDDFDSFFDNK